MAHAKWNPEGPAASVKSMRLRSVSGCVIDRKSKQRVHEANARTPYFECDDPLILKDQIVPAAYLGEAPRGSIFAIMYDQIVYKILGTQVSLDQANRNANLRIYCGQFVDGVLQCDVYAKLGGKWTPVESAAGPPAPPTSPRSVPPRSPTKGDSVPKTQVTRSCRRFVSKDIGDDCRELSRASIGASVEQYLGEFPEYSFSQKREGSVSSTMSGKRITCV